MEHLYHISGLCPRLKVSQGENILLNKNYLYQNALLDNKITGKPFNAKNHKIVNISNPTDNNDVVNKLYVDSLTGSAVQAVGVVLEEKFKNIPEPTSHNDAANKGNRCPIRAGTFDDIFL